MNDRSWMYQWIDEFELYTMDTTRERLKSPTVVARLYELAELGASDNELVRGDSWTDLTLVAGQGLNISAETSCSGYSCRRTELDELIGSAWHYFDKIVIAGPSPGDIKARVENTPPRKQGRLLYDLSNDVQTLLYLRHINAIERLAFRPDDTMHTYDCTAKNAASLGLEIAADKETKKNIIGQIEREAKISQQFELGAWSVRVSHPLLEEPLYFSFDKRQSRRQVAESMFLRYSGASVRDYMKAKLLELPLATRANSAWLRRPGQSNASAIGERTGRVALRLKLPTFVGLSAKDLIKAIDDHRGDYVRFQSALRAAISEAVKNLDSKGDDEIADAVYRDYIEPEIEKMNASLTQASRAFSKKFSAGITVGAVATSVGLLGAMPLVIGAGIAAGATVLPQVYKFFDDKASVRTSDMYFLWSLGKKRSH